LLFEVSEELEEPEPTPLKSLPPPLPPLEPVTISVVVCGSPKSIELFASSVRLPFSPLVS
jgi:hypothetical protein